MRSLKDIILEMPAPDINNQSPYIEFSEDDCKFSSVQGALDNIKGINGDYFTKTLDIYGERVLRVYRYV